MSSSARYVATLIVALLGVAASDGMLHGAGEAPVALIRGPFVQMATADSIVIVWRTQGMIQPGVKFGSRPDALDRSVAAAAIGMNDKLQKGVGGYAQDDVLAPGTRQYEARITGLEPLTTYYYAVHDGERRLAGGDETYRFRTYPPAGQSSPVRFAAFGDSHGADWLKSGAEQALQKLCAKEKHPVDFYLQLGDHTNKGRNVEYQYIFEPQDAVRRSVVWWPTIGNHDIVNQLRGQAIQISGPYCDAFALPMQGEAGGVASGTKAYYSFDFGRVHVVALASFFVSTEPDGPMANWVKADLAKAKADGKTDWIIAFVHSPPFTGPDTEWLMDQAELRAFILPILEAGGVDLILTGHNHIYERTMLVDGIYGTPMNVRNNVLNDGDGDPQGDGPYRKSAGLNPHEGVVAVTAGCGGGRPGEGIERPGEGIHAVAKRLTSEGGMLVVDIVGDTLTARMVRKGDADIRDTFSIVKRGQVTVNRLAQPRGEPVAVYARKQLQGDRFMMIPAVQDPVKLDGALDEAAWKKAVEVKVSSQSARFFVGPDGLCLGLGITGAGFGLSPESRVRETRRDGPLFRLDPTIDLYLDPGHDAKDVYHFATNYQGVQWDAKDEDASWNAEWDVKSIKAPNSWTVEIRIPWKAIGMQGPPTEDQVMGLNLLLCSGDGKCLFSGRGDVRYAGFHGRHPPNFGFIKFGPGRAEAIIPHCDTPDKKEWKYLAGQDAPAGWIAPEFNDAAWTAGAPGFGYGDIDNNTRLLDMKGKYSRVYTRRSFEVKDAAALTDLNLLVSYDDAFIAYLNGKEVLRVGVAEGNGAAAKGIAVHEGAGPEYPPDQKLGRFSTFPGLPLATEMFSLKNHLGLLRTGTNVLAIEGHNATLTSKAFTLDAHLVSTCLVP